MRSPASPLDRFVSALHRRLLVVRALEGTALGAAGGCAVGAILIPLLMWRGIEAITPTLWSLAIGCATGLLWSLTRLPTRLAAAAEADRQLALADLFGTALTVRQRARESDRDADAQPWLQTVVSLADAACRAHTPSQVIFHRLHARAWGGIALAAAGVVTVAALTAPDPGARAAGAGATGASNRRPPTESGREANRPTPARPAPLARSQGIGPQREGEQPAGQPVSKTPDEPETTGAAAPSGNRPSTGDQGTGGGTARARTPTPGEPVPRPSAGVNAPSETGETSTGGSGTTQAAPPGDTPGTAGGSAAAVPPAPPWRNPNWADDARRAQEAVDSGAVPDAHRDLVREYFDRDRR